MHIAQINIAYLRHPVDHPEIAGFVDALDQVNLLADQSPGFVWRLKSESGNATDVPFRNDPLWLVNLSVWQNLGALRQFVYRTEHREFLRHRNQWFVPLDEASMALWWVRPGHEPGLEEANYKLAEIAIHGPGPQAFTFGLAFDHNGKRQE